MKPALSWDIVYEVQSTAPLTVADLAELPSPATPLRSARNRKIRKRLALPITLHYATGPVRVMACPDTGSDDNIISLKLADQLQLELDSHHDREFSLANGKVVKSLGKATLRYSFEAANTKDSAALKCTVYIFETLVVPLIMGAEFLKETETLTQHRDRLIEEIVPSMQALQVNSVGKPKRGLVCRLDTFVGCANADTGSDLDLVSPEFARQRGFTVQTGAERLEFADGSIGSTSGLMQASFAIGNVDAVRGFVPRGGALNLDFYVLDGLTSDILIGQGTLDELGDAFQQHGDSFINSMPPTGLSDCHIIRHIGSVESAIKSALRSVKDTFARETLQSQSGIHIIFIPPTSG